MKQSRHIAIILLSAWVITFTACTEEITVDLNSADPQLVIEGSVSTSGNPVIMLSRSVNFDDPNDFPKVENAIVELSDDDGNREILPETSPGLYTTHFINGKEGSTYSLSVTFGEEQLRAESRIPQRVELDSIIVNRGTTPAFPGSSENGTFYQVQVTYKDPAGIVNYYRFLEKVNGITTNQYVFDDLLNDGQEVTQVLFDIERNLESGDLLEIEMQCIDRSVYDYFNSLILAEGGPGGPNTPSNPVSNIEGSELGYFSAHTSEDKEVRIQYE
jgi:hypothetical protein